MVMNILFDPLLQFKEILASLPSIQIFSGTSDALTAAEKIHLITTGKNPKGSFALIDFGNFARNRQKIINNTGFYLSSGSTLMLYMRGAVLPSNADEPAAAIAFTQHISDIWEALELAAGKIDSLHIIDIQLQTAPTRIFHKDRQATGDYYEVVFELTFSRQPYA
ncbi:MAG: hypothetical protein HRU15_20235 [Planctomycetes bacterium]|nr:hypothetical protein [Planctomycetota bacterium]